MSQDRLDIQQREASAAEKRAADEIATEQEKSDTEWQMSTKQGRRIVWNQLGECGIFRTSFTGNSETFFKEGQRDIGLRILARVMRHTPKQFTTMMAENNDG